MLAWKIECKLHLPGAWFLSSLPKRGIPFPASFTKVQPEPAQTASPRPVWSPTTIVSARTARLVTDLSRESNWDFRPRSRLRKSVSSLPLTVTPLVRPVTAWDLPVNSKSESGWRRTGCLPLSLRVLPEFPTFSPKPEEVVGPEYCSPVSEPICVTNWVRRSQLALPVDRFSRTQGLQTRDDHVPLSPEPAAWSTKFETVTQVSEPGLTITGLTITGLTIMDSCRPATSRSSRTGLDMAGPLFAILNPGPTRLRSPVTPSLIRPRLQSSDPNTPSPLEVSPSPHVFAVRQIRDDAIPEAETGAVGPRLWFAVRVPSPYLLERPTPVDTTKRPHYVHAGRHIRFTAIPAQLVPDPAGLPTASKRALGAAPDLLSDSAAFRAFGRSLFRESVPPISELQPPAAPVIQRALAPVDQLAAMAESVLLHNANRFPTGPAIPWTATVNGPVLREVMAPIRRVLPVPDCPQVFVFQTRAPFGPSWEFPFARPTGASFAAYAAPPYEPIGDLGGPPDAGRAVMPETALKPWNKPAQRASGMEEMLGPVPVAPALASFSRIAHPESMHSSFDTDLRDRIFNPILPQLPRTRLRPDTVEVIGSRLQESRVFAPVGFRWQRQRKVRDRGAPWKIPTRIGLRPPPAPPHWPGPLPVAKDDRPARFH